MSKLQWFVSSLIIMTGSLVFLSLFTYSGTLVHSIWFEEERFESETMIANMDISDLNQEEATLELQQEVAEWQANYSIELRWFDKKKLYPVESLNFLVDESIEDMMMSDELNESLIVLATEQQLMDTLEEFDFYPDVSRIVFLERLLNDLEEEVSTLPNEDIVINIHDYLFDDQVNQEQTISSTSRSYDSPLLETWIHDLRLITIEADSRFSLMNAMDEARIESLTEQPLSILASAVYEVMLHSNFNLIERVQSDTVKEDVPVGYDVKMVPEENDLVFENPNPIDYQLKFHYENNQLSVELIGEEFAYLISVDVEDQENIRPRTIVQYSDSLRKGSSQVVDSGKDGLNYQLVRSIVNPLDNENVTEQIANDYYPPIHRVEMRSKEDLVEEPEPDDFMDPGVGVDGSDGGNADGFSPSDGSSSPGREQPWDDGNRSESGSGSTIPDDRGWDSSSGSSGNSGSGNQGENSSSGSGSSGHSGEQNNHDLENNQAPPIFPKYDDDGHPIKGY